MLVSLFLLCVFFAAWIFQLMLFFRFFLQFKFLIFITSHLFILFLFLADNLNLSSVFPPHVFFF